MITAYPLQWPVGYKKTEPGKRQSSRFKNTLGRARDEMKYEVLNRLGGRDLVISTNLPTKQNGDLYADVGRYKIDSPGVAIYFKWRGRDIVMCCDQYLQVWENVVALTKGIEALRGLERWGVSEFLERAFTGFQGLPAGGEATVDNLWTVLDMAPTKDTEAINAQWRKLCKQKAYVEGELLRLNLAREAALKFAVS